MDEPPSTPAPPLEPSTPDAASSDAARAAAPDSSGETPDVSKVAPRPRSRLLRTLRALVRLAVVAVLLLLVAVVAVLFTPISLERADRELRARFLSATGLRLEFDRADWILSRGLLSLRSPALIDPADGLRLLEFAELEIRVEPESVVRVARGLDRRIEIPQITATDPSSIVLLSRDGSIEPEEGLRRLLGFVRERAAAGRPGTKAPRAVLPEDEPTTRTLAPPPPPPAATAAALPFDVAFGKVDVTGVRLVARDAEEASRELLVLRDLNFIAEFDGAEVPRRVVSSGRIAGSEAAGFTLILGPDPGRSEVTVDLRTQPLDTRLHLPSRHRFDARADAASIDGVLRLGDDGVLRFTSEASAPGIEIATPGAEGEEEIVRPLEGVRVFSTLEWRPEERLVRWEASELASLDCDAVGSVELSLAAPRPWKVRVEPARLRSKGLAFLESELFDEEFLTGDAREVEIRGELSGRLDEPDSLAPALDFVVAGVGVVLPRLPDPVADVRLKGSLSREALRIVEGSGVVEGIPLELSGELRGSPLEGRVDRIDLAWRTAGSLDGIADLIRDEAGAPATFRVRGDVDGSGTLSLAQPAEGTLAELVERAELAGSLTLRDCEIRHERMKKPLRGVGGRLEVKGDRARLVGMTGRVEDVSFALSGELKGRERFWVEPVADLELIADGRLENAASYFGWFDEKPPEGWPEIAGRAKATARARGPLSTPRELALEGELALDDFVWSLDALENKHLAGTLRARRLAARFDPEEMVLSGLEADWEGVRVTGGGAFGIGGGALDLVLDGGLPDFKRALPEGLERFDVSGPASIAARVELHPRKEAEPVARLIDLLIPPAAKEPAASPVARAGRAAPADDDATTSAPGFGDRFRAVIAGEATFTDSELTYDLMPTRLHGAFGKVRFDADRAWTERPLQLAVGDGARGTTIEGQFVFAKHRDDAFLIDVKIGGDYLNLDEWLTEWRDVDESKLDPNRPRHRDHPRWIVKADVATRRMTYRKLDGEGLKGNLSFVYYTMERAELRFDDVTVRRGGGDCGVTVVWRMGGDRYRLYDIRARDLELPPLLHAFFDVDERAGLSSGRVSGAMRLERTGPDGTPLSGAGEFTVRESRFVSNAVLGGLGRFARLEAVFDDIAFPRIEGRFEVRDDAVVVEGRNEVVLENPALLHPLSMKVQGSLGPARKLELAIHMLFLPRVADIPVIGAVWKAVNELAGRVVRYRVEGTLEEPRFTLLPKGL